MTANARVLTVAIEVSRRINSFSIDQHESLKRIAKAVDSGESLISYPRIKTRGGNWGHSQDGLAEQAIVGGAIVQSIKGRNWQ